MSIRVAMAACILMAPFRVKGEETPVARVISTGNEARNTFLELSKSHEKLDCLPGYAIQSERVTCIQWNSDDEKSDFTCFEANVAPGETPGTLDYKMFCISPSTIGVGNLD